MTIMVLLKYQKFRLIVPSALEKSQLWLATLLKEIDKTIDKLYKTFYILVKESMKKITV